MRLPPVMIPVVSVGAEDPSKMQLIKFSLKSVYNIPMPELLPAICVAVDGEDSSIEETITINYLIVLNAFTPCGTSNCLRCR